MAGTFSTILALSPREWSKTLGDWTDLFVRYRTSLLCSVIVILVTQLILAKQPFLARLEYMMPIEYQGIPDMTPQGIQGRVVTVLDEVGQVSSREHVVRIVVLTGGATLHYLDQVIDKYPTRSNWDIRVLITDPDSPCVEKLGKDAKEQVRASCARLESTKTRITSRARPAKISWRGYMHLPMIRGLSIDEDHMFFGYFVWAEQDGAWRLCEQNKRLVHARRGDELSRDSIAFFISWFDYEWQSARDLQSILVRLSAQSGSARSGRSVHFRSVTHHADAGKYSAIGAVSYAE
jgi:hypothetical protein